MQLRRTSAVLAVAVLLAALAPGRVAAGTEAAPPGRGGDFAPPVDAPVTDTFRRPETPFGAGNRGVDFATEAGEVVRAAAAGTVVFAGKVGLTKHVVVLHGGDIRTSYSFLETVEVRRGQRVATGDPVGTAAGPLHFGARLGDDYIDPLPLLGAPRRHAHLVPDDEPADGAARAVRAARPRRPPVPAGPPADEAAWRRDQEGCTPPEVAPPSRGRDLRRRAVLVGGLGSATGDAAILDVDTAALGYRAEDVSQFSYRADGSAYTATDTQQDIAASAAALAAHLAQWRRADPHVPIDVFAHSQGGLVARAALAAQGSLPGVATIVTLGTPHTGSALAASGASVETSRTGGFAVAAATAVRPGGIDPRSPSVGQLAPGSRFLTRLAAAEAAGPSRAGGAGEVPRLVSVAASTDPVVPVDRARWARAAHVTVDMEGGPSLLDHARLPGDPAATRELALAVAGSGVTCRDLPSWRRQRAVGAAFEAVQSWFGDAALAGLGWLDTRLPAGAHP